MTDTIIFVVGFLLGAVIASFIRVKRSDGGKKKLLERQADEKKRNLEGILTLLETQTPLTNNHIEQLLGISDATATRYLEELEEQGKIRQVGGTGTGVYYERVD